MLNYYKFIFKSYLYWLMVFVVYRIVFMFNVNTTSSVDLSVFLNAIRLDISMISYLMILPTFIIFSVGKIGASLAKKMLNTYFFIILFFISLIEYVSIPIFSEWENTVDSRALSYLENPGDVFLNIEYFFSITLFLLFIILFVIFKKILSQIIDVSLHKSQVFSSLHFLIIFGILFLGIRGGIQKIPIKVTSSFYSNDNVLNFISVNKPFYFLKSVQKNAEEKLLPLRKDVDYSELINSMKNNVQKTNFNPIISHPQPNIVIIILEGWPADLIEELGGEQGITPGFSSLIKDGYLFNNSFSSGFRTDQGFLSILSGVPSFANLNLLTDISLSHGFPSIFNSFNDIGYKTSFYYGGDTEFSNMKRYLLNNKVSQFIDQYDFSFSDQSMSWGVPDRILFNRVQEELKTMTEPFFSTILTSSSHNPFDIPETYQFGEETQKSKYKSSVYYSDKYLKQFIQNAKTQKWYNNTLFIIVSDHGTKYLESYKINEHDRYKVPLLFYGNVLNDSLRNQRNEKIINQYDLPNTILGLLNKESDIFPFSKNILTDTVPTFGYWARNSFAGFYQPSQNVVFNYKKKTILSSNPEMVYDSKIVQNKVQFLEILSEYIRTKSILIKN